MDKTIRPHRDLTNAPFSMLALAVLAWITYGIFAHAPYIGFYFNPTNGQILEVYLTGDLPLQIGDELVSVREVSLQDYRADARRALFPADLKQGNIVPLTLEREGREIMVQWEIPGFNEAEFLGRFFNIWWLAYFFWIIGSTIEFFMRPKDVRWRLMVAANHLTGIWVIMGSFSATHLWESSVLLHAVTWLIVPVYLHLNWIFPKPLAVLPKFFSYIFYLPPFLLFAAELFQLVRRDLYAMGLILALLGSLILQAIHFIANPAQRRQIGLLALSTLLAVSPAIILGILRILGQIPQAAPAALLALPFAPAAYSYLIFRDRLGGLQVRAHRVITTYAFLILVTSVLLIILTLGFSLELPPEETALFAFVIPLLASAVSISSFPSFQAFVEQRFLGIKLPYQNLSETYSSRITTSTSTSSLLRLLEEDVFPSLLIRQYAFIQVVDGKIKPLLVRDVPADQLPGEEEIPDWIARGGKFIPSLSSPGEWIRLILPLKVGDSHLGFWLLGRRDPDDLYPFAEISVLQSIADQTAVALSNILHADQLLKTYQMNIERHERERMRLALELHDSILNQIGYLRRSLDETILLPQFISGYEELTRRLREIVGDLLPPMLSYGLHPALVDLAENLMERTGDSIEIGVELEQGEGRVPEQMELQIFRIVQQACENALKHAEAKNIRIHGKISAREVDLCIEDDGKGFDAEIQRDLNALVGRNRFGLMGMIERARLIRAEIQIQSHPGRGTKIRVAWRSES